MTREQKLAAFRLQLETLLALPADNPVRNMEWWVRRKIKELERMN